MPLIEAMAAIGFIRPLPDRGPDEPQADFETRLRMVETRNRAASEAATTLHRMMRRELGPRVQSRLGCSLDEIEDAVQLVLFRLCKMELGDAARLRLTDDSHARFYLEKSMRRSILRDPSPPDFLPEIGKWDPDPALAMEMERLRGLIRDTLVPRIVARRRAAAGRDFSVTVDQILAVFDGETDMPALLLRERQSGRDRATPGGETYEERLRNRIYRRFGRALEELHDETDGLVQTNELSEERGDTLHRFLAALVLRVNRTPRGTSQVKPSDLV